VTWGGRVAAFLNAPIHVHSFADPRNGPVPQSQCLVTGGGGIAPNVCVMGNIRVAIVLHLYCLIRINFPLALSYLSFVHSSLSHFCPLLFL
jgi:hypothetical protein